MGGKNTSARQIQITLQPSVPSQKHWKSLDLPLTCQTDKRRLDPASWFLFKCAMEEAKSAAVAPPPCYDLSCLCRVPVCGRQLPLKLVTVQLPTCQLNGLFICPRAMHYGPEPSLLKALSLLNFPFAHNENPVIATEIKCTLYTGIVCMPAHAQTGTLWIKCSGVAKETIYELGYTALYGLEVVAFWQTNKEAYKHAVIALFFIYLLGSSWVSGEGRRARTRRNCRKRQQQMVKEVRKRVHKKRKLVRGTTMPATLR